MHNERWGYHIGLDTDTGHFVHRDHLKPSAIEEILFIAREQTEGPAVIGPHIRRIKIDNNQAFLAGHRDDHLGIYVADTEKNATDTGGPQLFERESGLYFAKNLPYFAYEVDPDMGERGEVVMKFHSGGKVQQEWVLREDVSWKDEGSYRRKRQGGRFSMPIARAESIDAGRIILPDEPAQAPFIYVPLTSRT